MKTISKIVFCVALLAGSTSLSAGWFGFGVGYGGGWNRGYGGYGGGWGGGGGYYRTSTYYQPGYQYSSTYYESSCGSCRVSSCRTCGGGFGWW